MGSKKCKIRQNLLSHFSIYFSRRGVPSQMFLRPIPVHSSPERYPQHLERQASWLSLSIAWLRYHSIQLRWDVERTMARLFRRRWI